MLFAFNHARPGDQEKSSRPYTDAIGEVNASILQAFRERGIRIPPPRTDVRMVEN